MRYLVGMSGGLDSTYAAYLLLQDGHDVAGAWLRMDDASSPDTAYESARQLGISCLTVDARPLFEREVIAPFCDAYRRAETPNPCILCNAAVKFACLYETAREGGYDRIATGHYARLVCRDGRYTLARAQDAKKDQTYMLWRLSQEILSHLDFPLSALTKDAVRASARQAGFTASDLPESQEICFLHDGDYASYIEERTGKMPEGDFVTEDGRVVGRHKGILHYTVGQRRGLGVALGERMFISRIDSATNRIVLSRVTEIGCDRFYVRDMHFTGLAGERKGELLSCLVKHRYAAHPVPCTLRFTGGGYGEVTAEMPLRSVTPGQSAVFYDGDVMLCGGFIMTEPPLTDDLSC